MTEKTFATELTKLRVYGQVFDTQLESLERERLVVPRWRLRFPDEVARRLWLGNHGNYVLNVPVEPDGQRWKAAVDLVNGLYRWCNHIVYGPSSHPFDDLSERFAPFVENPAAVPFRRWDDRRVDVSNNHHAVLFEYRRDETFYSSWQLLLAAEVAHAGIHIRVDLSNAKVAEEVHRALDAGRLPSHGCNINIAPVHTTRDFRANVAALDAVVWFAEESERAFHHIIRNVSGGRFMFTQEQATERGLAKTRVARNSVARFGINADTLINLLKFLSGRWLDWDREGRPLIAGAYKEMMYEAVGLLPCAFEMDFLSIKSRVGHPGGWHEPVLDKVWPDWKAEQQERVRRTLRSAIGAHGVTADEINAFVAFLSDNNLEAFYWRLKTFEEHAFRGNEYAIEGMQADLQGMAVAVEHVVEVLGGTEIQLYEKFKQIWREPAVLALLKRGDVAMLSRQARLAQDWASLKAKIEALREEAGGDVAADLVMAHRIRGGVHTVLPEDDQFQLEALLVSLMRAAVMTFAEVKRREWATSPAIASNNRPQIGG